MPVETGSGFVPMVAIHPNRLNFYGEAIDRRMRRPELSLKNLNKGFKRNQAVMSDATRRKVNKSIEYLLFLANPKTLPGTPTGRSLKFRIAFVTLTLPSTQVHSDQVIKEQCLNQMLIEMRKKWHVRNYIWRAEKQINGNIHFHVLVDKFIPWSELRDCWNRITNKLGYVNRYRDQMREFHNGGFKVRADLLKVWEYKKQIRAYQAGKANDWNSPNSTDIHSVVRVGNLSAYLAKYYTKQEQNQGLTGRFWGCNYELSDIPGARVVVDSQVYAECQELFKTHRPPFYRGDYFTTVEIDYSMLSGLTSDVLFRMFASFLIEHFDYHIQKNITNT